MKKNLAIMLIIFLILSLTACGGGAKRPEGSSAPESIESNVSTRPEEPKEAEAIPPVAKIVEGAEIPEFSVTIQGVEITNIDMAPYPVFSVQTTSTNTYGTTTTRVYVGYTASDMLKAAGITEGFSTFVTLADDGYTISVSETVALEPTTLIAISEDDKLFINGPWFAPCTSNVSPDYLRDLVSITLES